MKKMTRLLDNQRTYLLLIFVSCLTFEVTPASPAHIHSHQINKERVEDGAYIARDRNHYVDGKHHSEFDHEAILGSVKEAEEYDHLPPEIAKQRLRILLDKIDINNNKFIERNELKAWIHRSFKMLNNEESLERFEDADEDLNGRISWEEYKKDTFGDDDDEFDLEKMYDLPERVKQEEEAMLKHDHEQFLAADLNKDGWLNKSEFLRFTHPEEFPDMIPIIIKQTLEEKDVNHDGAIDFKEFLGPKGRNHDKEWLITEKDRFDQEYDKNGDGILTGDEIASWVIPSNDEIIDEEVKHLFLTTDEDQDDLLSFDEIINNHEIFVGSEATDYGEHLHNIHTFMDEL